MIFKLYSLDSASTISPTLIESGVGSKKHRSSICRVGDIDSLSTNEHIRSLSSGAITVGAILPFSRGEEEKKKLSKITNSPSVDVIAAASHFPSLQRKSTKRSFDISERFDLYVISPTFSVLSVAFSALVMKERRCSWFSFSI